MYTKYFLLIERILGSNSVEFVFPQSEEFSLRTKKQVDSLDSCVSKIWKTTIFKSQNPKFRRSLKLLAQI